MEKVVIKSNPDGTKHYTTTYKAKVRLPNKPCLLGKVGRKENYNCLDCYKDTCTIEDDYSIHDDIWLSVVPGWVGHLCLRCLRTRLGRDLQLSDFMLEYEVNSHINQEFLDEINN
jgi:hypothetical protein